MPTWPVALGDGQQTQSYGAAPTTVLGVSIASTSTANAKPTSWSVLTASTAFDAVGIYVTMPSHGSTCGMFVDIGVGPDNPNTVVIIPNIYFSFPKTPDAGLELYFPISIPAGSRLVARFQATTGSLTAYLAIRLQGAGGLSHPPRSVVQAIGDVLAQTRGTEIPSPVVTNPLVTGEWTKLSEDITAAVADLPAYPIEEVLLSFQTPPGVATVSWNAFVDIGVGDTGSVTPILQLHLGMRAQPDHFTTAFFGPFPCSIPAGVQINMRHRRTAGVSAVYAVLYGVS